MIKGEGVSVNSPDGRLLLNNIDFLLEKGERLAFTGPNGCGKSTLLREIAGLEENSRGIIREIDMTEISYIPTRPLDLLLPWNTVQDNIFFFSELAKKQWPEINQFNNDFGKSFGYDLEPAKEKEVYKLSSGQQALLAILCAMIKRPKLIVSDEIFSTLSKDLRSSVANVFLVKEFTIVLATHDNDFIQSINARNIQLDKNIVHND